MLRSSTESAKGKRCLFRITSVRLQVEQNQLVAVFIGIVLGIGGFECPWNGRFLEERDAENL